MIKREITLHGIIIFGEGVDVALVKLEDGKEIGQ